MHVPGESSPPSGCQSFSQATSLSDCGLLSTFSRGQTRHCGKWGWAVFVSKMAGSVHAVTNACAQCRSLCRRAA